MNNQILQYIWEASKTLIPPFVAWRLATRTATKNSEQNKKEAREQLWITRENNAYVQNMTYKLQFCLQELEKREALFERLTSDTNVVINSLDRFIRMQISASEVSESASQMNISLHEVIYSIGSMQSIVRASSAGKENEYLDLVKELINKGKLVEGQVDFLLKKQANPKFKKEVRKIQSSNSLKYFLNQLESVRTFIMELIFIVMKKMG